MMKEIRTATEAETELAAQRLAESFSGDETVALFGGLGMGKTAFVRGLAKGLGIDPKEISSPTFAIVHEHRSISGNIKLCHYDMYRVESWEDLDSTGYPETVGRCVNAVEWSENIENALSYPRWQITIHGGEKKGERTICIEYLEGE